MDWIRRNSRVRLDKEGRWSLDGKPVEHPRVQKLFHSGVSQDLESGEAKLMVGTQWCYIEHLEDTAFFVSALRVRDGQIEVDLADGQSQIIDPATFTMRGDSDVYCRLASGHRARLLRDAVASLDGILCEVGDGFGITVGTRIHPIARDD
ncbi:MAG: hypothetical protein ACI9OJ_005536 [Myxococcota bacterium]